MARISFEYTSKTIDQPTRIQIYIPDKLVQGENIDKVPVIYLLHGKNDNEEAWGLKTNAYQYADMYGFILVMPYAANSFYTNMAYGYDYWNYIAEELPEIMNKTFKITNSKEITFVCGYSMGGYGALKLGIIFPERYKAIASLSGSLRSIEINKEKIQKEYRKDLLLAFGDCGEMVKQKNDIYYLTEKVLREEKKLPKIYLYCGTNDGLYDFNFKYKEYALKNGLDLIFREDSGDHSYYYWDKELKIFMETISKNLCKQEGDLNNVK